MTDFPTESNTLIQSGTRELQELKEVYPEANPSKESDQEDTEDEEVKMNCIVGERGMHESDLSLDGGGNNSGNEEDDTPLGQKDGVVDFVSGHFENAKSHAIHRPKPIISRRPLTMSSSVQDREESCSDVATDSSSLAARGAPIDLDDSNQSSDSTTSKDTSDDSDDSDDSEDQQTNECAQTSADEVSSSQSQEEEVNDRSSSEEEGDSPTQQSDMLLALSGNPPQLSVTSQLEDTALTSSTTKTKRVLSSNTLALLNADAGRPVDCPKKMRSGSIPKLDLGISVLDQLRTRPSTRTSFEIRRGNNIELSSDEEELDKRLSEELDCYASDDSSRVNSPVPLLTPPQSPLRVDVGEGTTTVCEWPSNLVVDSALMTAATDVRPMSPASLQKFELDEEERVSSQALLSDKEVTSLTPLLHSIYVGTD